MSLPADGVNANTLAETTTIPTGKKLIFLDSDTNEGGIITLENLTKQILSNLTSQTFNLDQGNKTLLAALNELNSNAFPCYKLNADNETHKESFKKWYLSLPEQTFCAVNFNAGWQCMLIGFKSDNEYGTFLRLQYGMEISKFCDILNGEFSFT